MSWSSRAPTIAIASRATLVPLLGRREQHGARVGRVRGTFDQSRPLEGPGQLRDVERLEARCGPRARAGSGAGPPRSCRGATRARSTGRASVRAGRPHGPPPPATSSTAARPGSRASARVRGSPCGIQYMDTISMYSVSRPAGAAQPGGRSDSVKVPVPSKGMRSRPTRSSPWTRSGVSHSRSSPTATRSPTSLSGRVLLVLVAQAERLEPEAPVLARGLAHQLGPQPVGADLEQAALGRVDVVVAHDDHTVAELRAATGAARSAPARSAGARARRSRGCRRPPRTPAARRSRQRRVVRHVGVGHRAVGQLVDHRQRFVEVEAVARHGPVEVVVDARRRARTGAGT